MKKIDEKINLILTKFYAFWDSKKIKIPEKLRNPLDKAISKLQGFNASMQRNIFLGTFVGVFILFFLTMCTGGSPKEIVDPNYAKAEAVVAEQKAQDLKEKSSLDNKLLEDIKNTQIKDLLATYFPAMDMGKADALSDEAKKALKERINSATNYDDCIAVADKILKLVKFRTILGFKDADAISFQIKAIKAAKNPAELKKIKIDESALSDAQKQELLALCFDPFTKNYIDALAQTSRESAATWIIEQIKAGNTKFIEKLIAFEDTKVAVDYFAKNMTAENIALLKGSAILFNYYKDQNKITEALAEAKPNLKNNNVLKAVYDLALSDNAQAIEVFEGYFKTSSMPTPKKSDEAVNWMVKYNFVKKDLVAFETSTKTEGDKAKALFNQFRKIFQRDSKPKTKLNSDHENSLIPSQETLTFIFEKLQEIADKVETNNLVSMYKEVYTSSIAEEALKDKAYLATMDLIDTKFDAGLIASLVKNLGEASDLWKKHYSHIEKKAEDGLLSAKYFYIYSNVVAVNNPNSCNMQKCKSYYYDFIINDEGVEGFNYAISFFLLKSANVIDLFEAMFDDLLNDKLPKMSEPAKADAVYTISSSLKALTLNPNKKEQANKYLETKEESAFYKLQAFMISSSKVGGRQLSKMLPTSEVVDNYKQLFSTKDRCNGDLLKIGSLQLLGIVKHMFIKTIKAEVGGFPPNELKYGFENVQKLYSVIDEVKQAPSVYLYAGQIGVELLKLGDKDIYNRTKSFLERVMQEGSEFQKEQAQKSLKSL